MRILGFLVLKMWQNRSYTLGTLLGLTVAAAFAIDLGHLFFVKRDMQKAADAAAQAAAQRPDDAQRTAQEVARLNGFDADAGVVTATLGRWDPAGPTQACPPWRSPARRVAGPLAPATVHSTKTSSASAPLRTSPSRTRPRKLRP